MFMKKSAGWLAIILLSPIVLFAVLAVLLYIPPVQNWAVRQVASYASEKTGMDISVGRVCLAFPLDLRIEDFRMIQQNGSLPQLRDTVADVRKLTVDVRSVPLLKGRVEINALELTDTKVNTAGFVPSARIKGCLGRLFLQSHGIDLSAETVKVNTVSLENAMFDVALSDTVPPDTTESKADWKIDIDNLEMLSTDFALHLPGDTMSVKASMEKALVRKAFLGLKDGVYNVDAIDWQGGGLNYDMNYVARSKGFDASHIALTDVFLGVDSFRYASPDIALYVRAMRFDERSGLGVKNLTGHFVMDSARVMLLDMSLETQYSRLSADFRMDLNAFDSLNPGRLYMCMDGCLGMNDVVAFVPEMPSALVDKFPGYPLEIKGTVAGNLECMKFNDISMYLPASFRLSANGWVSEPADADRIRMDMELKARTENLAFVTAVLPDDVSKIVRLPHGIDIDGRFSIVGTQYSANLSVGEGGGTLKVDGMLDARSMAYDVKAKAMRLQLQHFVRNVGLHPFTGDITMRGRGTDVLSPQTEADIAADIRQFRYDRYQLDGMRGDLKLRAGYVHARVNGSNSLLGGDFSLDGIFRRNNVDVDFRGVVTDADLQAFGIMDKRYLVSTDACLNVKSDLRNSHSVKGHVGDLSVCEFRDTDTVVPLVLGDFDIDGALDGNALSADFSGRIGRMDLYQLGMLDTPLSLAVSADVGIKSNLDDLYEVRGFVGDVMVKDNSREYQAGDMTLDVFTRRDTTHAVVDGGDFHVNMDAQGGYGKIISQLQALTEDVRKQIADKRLVQSELCRKLPCIRLAFHSGADNLLATLLRQQGYSFSEADIEFTSSAATGINGKGHVSSLSLARDSITLDSVYLALVSDTSRIDYDVRVCNNSDNAYPFTGKLGGFLHETGLLAKTTITDLYGKTGLDLALLASLENDGININMVSPSNIIGYKEFHVNDGNYIFIGRDQRVSANMKLQADDGTGLFVYTDDSDVTALQNITLSMHKFELEKIFSVLPYMPRVSGELNGDLHVVQDAEDITFSSDLTVKDLVYENNPMGNVGGQFVYMPQSDGTHYVDAVITKDSVEVGTLVGTYDSKDDGNIDAELSLARFPLNYVNGFVPEQIVGLRGTGDGNLTVKGPLGRLSVDGDVCLDSCYLYSVPYGVELRFADDFVHIENSRLVFDDFEMYANNNSPLNIEGSLDFSDMSDMTLDLRMRAADFLLIDAKENPRSEAYGKAYVNFFATVKGSLDQLNMMGKLDILGNTDMTYVLKESALATDNQMDELIKFTDFNDTISEAVTVRPDMTGLKMAMSIDVDEQAHIVCALNADHSNYIDLIGGGSLRMSFDPVNDLRLMGRYTLSSGEMKYSLPVIPLHTFNIKDGSYIEFKGDPYDPTLNITATENIKTSVADGSSAGKIVDFECGVSLTQTMAKPTIEFIIEAPEDMQMQNELNTKSVEERGKLAVSMLASGMYLGEGGSTANSAMSGALASFMQSEINSITGSALRSMGLDLSADLETSTDATGSLHTDYTFKFSKQLLDNRLRIIMGGKVSTGSEAAGDNGAFFDDFSMEYRLNRNETQYLKLFYEREAYDWLEGNVSEFGAGFLWRRKLDKLKDIFRLRKTVVPMPVPVQKKDTLVTFTDENK